jgi:putative addiction module killer protein
MVEVIRSATFDRWLRKLKDPRPCAGIGPDQPTGGRQPRRRQTVGSGVSELRISYGPGYRIYYLHEGDRVILLLTGGDKSSQDADIRAAHQIADEGRGSRP